MWDEVRFDPRTGQVVRVEAGIQRKAQFARSVRSRALIVKPVHGIHLPVARLPRQRPDKSRVGQQHDLRVDGEIPLGEWFIRRLGESVEQDDCRTDMVFLGGRSRLRFEPHQPAPAQTELLVVLVELHVHDFWREEPGDEHIPGRTVGFQFLGRIKLQLFGGQRLVSQIPGQVGEGRIANLLRCGIFQVLGDFSVVDLGLFQTAAGHIRPHKPCCRQQDAGCGQYLAEMAEKP